MKDGFSIDEFCPQEIRYFTNGNVSNRIVSYGHKRSHEKCIFVPNWRAKKHHWDEFCDHLADDFSVEYFETREKSSTVSSYLPINFENRLVSSDIINYLNSQSCNNYHLILCSFSAPLVMSHWDELLNKPLSLTMICPIKQVSLPWIVGLFAMIPNRAIPFLYKAIFKVARNIKAVKPICKNLEGLIKDNDMGEIKRLQASIREVLKLNIPYSDFAKASIPTLVIKPINDKIHSPVVCHKIKNMIDSSVLFEVENFREAHRVHVAKHIHHFMKNE